MRRLLDYTCTGRWLTLTTDAIPAAQAADEAGQAAEANPPAPAGEPQGETTDGASPIRRLLQYTVSGHWNTMGAELTEEALAQLQQLRDDTFFGLDVKEIPAEKWREIAPLFER